MYSVPSIPGGNANLIKQKKNYEVHPLIASLGYIPPFPSHARSASSEMIDSTTPVGGSGSDEKVKFPF